MEFLHSESDKSTKELKPVSIATRNTIVRIRNCIAALADCRMMLHNTSILYAFEESKKYKLQELLSPEAMFEIAFLAQHRLKTQAQ